MTGGYDDLTPDDWQAHYRRLEFLYSVAPVNRYYTPRLSIEHQKATLEVDVDPKFFHAAHAVHGSVYFKMLDDAAFFAANTLESEVFVLTTAFTTYITRPVSSGTMRAVGKVVNQNKMQFIAESIAYDSENREIARGNGIFVRSKIPLNKAVGYE